MESIQRLTVLSNEAFFHKPNLLLILFIGLVLSACPTGWDSFNGYCYYKHDVTPILSGMSWNDSRLACQSYGGDLVSITSQAEQTFLVNHYTPGQRRQFYWIGFTDQAREGNWKWSDGSSASYTNWRTASGEPNNWGGNENCAETTNDGKWNDNNCERKFAFICKKREGKYKHFAYIYYGSWMILFHFYDLGIHY